MRFGVIDWDARQLCIANELENYGHSCILIKSVEETEESFDVLVLPIKGCNDQYQVPLKRGLLDLEEYLKHHRNVLIFSGLENPWINQLTLNVRYLMSIPDVIEQNAQLTAQGVIAEIVKYIDIDFRGLDVDVIGYGNCGKCIVRMLGCIVRSVRIIVKSSEIRKLENSIEYDVITYDEWSVENPARLIINTAPALVITKEIMNTWNSKPIILDIASYQGGVDYEIARTKNIKAYLLPSLPPLYTPKSAGKILADAILKEISHE